MGSATSNARSAVILCMRDNWWLCRCRHPVDLIESQPRYTSKRSVDGGGFLFTFPTITNGTTWAARLYDGEQIIP